MLLKALCKSSPWGKLFTTKTLLIMKFTAIILLSACLTASANGYSQITLSEKNAPLQKVFKEIQKQSGYDFFYTYELLHQAGTVTVKVSNVSLETALKESLKDKDLTYEIINKTIVIKQKIKEPANELSTPPIDVKGRVVNEKGEPVAGASVQVRGDKTKGTSTDEKGYFELTGIEENATLVISGVNIETFEVKVAGKADLTNLNAKTKITEGEAVTVEVNTGYQRIPRERATGSFEFINIEKLNRTTGFDLLSRLEGVTPSLFFDRRNMTGSESTVPINSLRIRGVHTLTNGGMGAPLIILNNFPFDGDINNINPNDVESITVLKDAAAASIYGAKATNGVIVITTKQGQYNQPLRLSLSSNYTYIERPDLFHYPSMSSSEFIDLEAFLFDKGYYDADLNDPGYISVSPVVEILAQKRNGSLSAVEADKKINLLRGIEVRNDFEKYIYRRSLSHQYSLNLNGGNDRLKYSFSSGFDLFPSILQGDKQKRITITSDNSYLLSKGAELQFGMRYANTESNANSLGDFGSSAYNYQQGGMSLYPYARLADENGVPLSIAKDYREGYTDTAGQGQLLNWKYFPLEERNFRKSKTKGEDILLSGGLNLKILASLNLQLDYQFQNTNLENSRHFDQQSYFTRNMINLFTNLYATDPSLRNPVPVGDILDLSSQKLTSHKGRAQLNFSKTWKSKHEINSLAAAEVREVVTTSNGNRFYGYQEYNLSTSNVDYINSFPLYGNRGSRAIEQSTALYKNTDHFVSLFGNMAYTFLGRYIISGSVRKDAANLFGVSLNNKWKPFWSLGASWILSKESFFKADFINFLKMRGSFGYTGNVNNSITPNTTISGLPANSSMFNLPYYFITTPANPGLSWETSRRMDVAVEFRLFKNRVSGTIEYYNNSSDNLILNSDMDPTTGILSVQRNSASMVGKGIEISANYQIIKNPFSWVTEISFNHISNKVTDYKLDESRLTSEAVVSSSGLAIAPRKGFGPYSLFSFPFAGLDPLNGDPIGYLGKDKSKDYSAIRMQLFDTSNVIYHGSSIPTFFGIFNQIFSYKNLAITASFSYRLGYYFRKKAISYNALVDVGSLHRDYSKRWMQPGDELRTIIPSLSYPLDNGDRDFFYAASSVNVLRGDNIKLNQVRLSYSLEKTRIAGLKAHRIQIYATIDNLGIIWRMNKDGLDPDVNTGNALYQLPKRISGGVRFEF